MARAEMDPATVDALARAHQQQVLDTYRLYGQRDGTDQPEALDRLPFEGLFAWIRAQADPLLTVVVTLLVVATCLRGGPMP